MSKYSSKPVFVKFGERGSIHTCRAIEEFVLRGRGFHSAVDQVRTGIAEDGIDPTDENVAYVMNVSVDELANLPQTQEEILELYPD